MSLWTGFGLFGGQTLKKASIDELAGLAKKNILVVGGTSGIGRALAISCLSRNAAVTIVGRRTPDEALSKATFFKKDLSLLRNANELGTELPLESFDIVVFSNGIMTTPERKETVEKIEIDMATSYLSRLAIVKYFKEFAKRQDKTRKPRVFIFGYPGNEIQADLTDFNSEKKYSAFPAHMNTVVGNEALVNHLHDKLGGKVNVYGLNPGLIVTEIRDQFLGKNTWASYFVEGAVGLVYPTAEQYSENVLIHLLASAEFENASKALFKSDGTLLKPNPWLIQEGRQDIVMKESEKLLERALAVKL